jgi:hypothetical protein
LLIGGALVEGAEGREERVEADEGDGGGGRSDWEMRLRCLLRARRVSKDSDGYIIPDPVEWE